MPPIAKPISADDIANDAAHMATFLRTLESIIPGHVDDELLAYLDSLQGNRLTREVLAKVLNAAESVRR